MAVVLSPSPPLSVSEDGILTVQNNSTSIAKDYPAIRSLIRNCRNVRELKQLHAQVTKMGLVQSPSSISNLIAACAEMATSQSLDYARKAFELFVKDEAAANYLFMWNCLIRGYSSAAIGDEAISLYLRMVTQGLAPDHFTFPFLLSACTKVAAFQEGFQAHASLIKMGLEHDIFIQNSLIHFYSECGEIDSARRVFDGMSQKNVVSWTSLICGYARRDNPREAVSLFFDMVEAGVTPNSVTMVCVVSACAKLRDLGLGEAVCACIGKSGVRLNSILVNALVDMYMKCGATETAKQLFDECDDRNVVLYNTIMSNYVHQGMAREALAILDEMLRLGPRPDKVTMLTAVSASAQLNDLGSGKVSHGYVLRNGLEEWDAVSNAIIDMYMKCGKPETACRVFDHMSNKTVVSWNSVIAGFITNGDVESAWSVFNAMLESDLVSWNTMISALVQQSRFEEAIELFRVMQSEAVEADRVTMVGMASACGYLGALGFAKWVHAYIERNRIRCDMRLSTALIDMYARCGDSQSSLQVFEKMREKDVSAWTAAIGAMAMEGNGERAIEIFDEMLRQGLKPDGVAFVAVLTACSHSGLVEQGRCLFRSMKNSYGILPQVVHYGCMVDLLGRAGLLEEAHDLIKSMPMKPNDVVWGALLSACRIHNNVELAAYAAEKVIELAPERTGIHVLLSNIYASARRWNDVARVRLRLKERGVQKLPGSSSIEVGGMIHEFTSGDESHPQMPGIVKMLHEISCRLKDEGHVPDLANVLLDVDEQEKEHLLSRHSEKLSIAFALISTSQGVPIRVVKNLRICTDCHSFAKLVSEVYSRKIIVRDNNRFHLFHQGLCSCGDYW
uniref:DYW domain-containing protein n=1 Tax=Nelumbo nucifera TaxID=4432 RepID=A0A822ZPL0_NELNU|nr:TPA_asm: hypothetical protein HUJ06_017851 [Nelumbo nucifera]